MRRNFGSLSFVPSGLVAESVSCVGETMVVTARAEAGEAFCPVCGEASRRVHKRFKRIALRCEKTARNFASFLALACAFILIKSVHTP